MRNNKGFTLIELVVVIVILGILAAVAIPKFVDISADARNAAAQGVAGAISSGSAVNYATYTARNGVTSTSGPFALTGATNALVCTPANLQNFVSGSMTLVASGATGSNQFNVGALTSGGACGTAGATVNCTITAAGSGAVAQTATVTCTN